MKIRHHRFVEILWFALVSLAFINALFTDPALGDEKGLKPLQGTWELVSAQKDGKDITKECMERGYQITIRGDKWIQDVDGHPLYTASNSTVSVDENHPIKEFVQTVTWKSGGADTSVQYPGIYRVAENTLELCFGVESKDRPTTFGTKLNDGHFYATLKRSKPVDKIK